MSTNNICFYGEIRKYYPRIITKYSSLTIPLQYMICHINSMVCNDNAITTPSKKLEALGNKDYAINTSFIIS